MLNSLSLSHRCKQRSESFETDLQDGGESLEWLQFGSGEGHGQTWKPSKASYKILNEICRWGSVVVIAGGCVCVCDYLSHTVCHWCIWCVLLMYEMNCLHINRFRFIPFVYSISFDVVFLQPWWTILYDECTGRIIQCSKWGNEDLTDGNKLISFLF
jgi:hypothetical protein